jgi:tRNA pseudouridine38-40 synthase
LYKTTALRYFLELSYNGTAYHGWQRQPNAISVQELLEKALSALLGTTTPIVGAGRTDTGVHARQMFAHFDAHIEAEASNDLVYRLNSFLPKDISIQAVCSVGDEAHARFDATARSYQYQLIQHKDPFLTHQAYCFTAPLDVSAMNQADQLFLDHQNFKCFSRSKTDVKTYDCDVRQAYWETKGSMLVFHITADRFLRNMVRAIVGTLLDVGVGKSSLDDVQKILDSQDRTNAGSSAPAHGLFLTHISYPNTIFDAHEVQSNK